MATASRVVYLLQTEIEGPRKKKPQERVSLKEDKKTEYAPPPGAIGKGPVRKKNSDRMSRLDEVIFLRVRQPVTSDERRAGRRAQGGARSCALCSNAPPETPDPANRRERQRYVSVVSGCAGAGGGSSVAFLRKTNRVACRFFAFRLFFLICRALIWAKKSSGIAPRGPQIQTDQCASVKKPVEGGTIK